MLGFLTAAALLAPPAITNVPCEGMCGSSKPYSAVVVPDQDRALTIYRPYFECYWTSLVGQPGFGSGDAARSQSALIAARNECAAKRMDADRNLDRFLKSTGNYGDDGKIVEVRDQFRRQAGTAFNYMTASATGRRAEYLKTMQSALGLEKK